MGAKGRATAAVVSVMLAGFLPTNTCGSAGEEAGVRAAGQGGAFVAKADDTSALFYNPAGLAFLRGFRIKANVGFGHLTVTASPPGAGAVAKSNPSQFLGTVALTWQFFKRATLGLGISSTRIINTEWPASWEGNSLSMISELSSLYFRPAVSVEILRGLSAGFGVDIVSSDIEWVHAVPQPFSIPDFQGWLLDSKHNLNGKGTGFDLGILWKAHRLIQFGFKYQHQVRINFTGIGSISVGMMSKDKEVPGPEGSITYFDLFNKFYKNQNVRSQLALPREILFGVSLFPLAKLSFHLDVQRTDWGEFGSWEFRSTNDDQHLSPEFNPLYQDFYGVSPNYGVQGVGLVLKDAWTIKGGVEYRPKEYFAVRGGFAHAAASTTSVHLNPVDPDLARNAISLGFGFEGPLFSPRDYRKVSELSLDVFMRYEFSEKQTSSLPGFGMAYQVNRWAAGVALGINL